MIDRLIPVGRLLLLLITTTVLILSFCGVPFVHAASPHTCVSAQVPAAFRLPDGALHPAGMLTVCRAQTFSPVGVLHLISVNRSPVGMFLGQSRRSEGAGASVPEIVFRRGMDGALELLGYTVPAPGRSFVHRLMQSSRESSSTAESGWAALPVVAALGR